MHRLTEDTAAEYVSAILGEDAGKVSQGFPYQWGGYVAALEGVVDKDLCARETGVESPGHNG
jgi:hypothetical protein